MERKRQELRFKDYMQARWQNYTGIVTGFFSKVKRTELHAPQGAKNDWWRSFRHNAKRIKLNMTRMLFPFNRVLMILAPAWPPAKEAIAVGRMNPQLIASMEA